MHQNKNTTDNNLITNSQWKVYDVNAGLVESVCTYPQACRGVFDKTEDLIKKSSCIKIFNFLKTKTRKEQLLLNLAIFCIKFKFVSMLLVHQNHLSNKRKEKNKLLLMQKKKYMNSFHLTR